MDNNDTGAVLHISDDTFQQQVLENDKTVLVDFWAPWCGPCKAIAPLLEEIAGERQDIQIVKVNVDDNQETAKNYDIRAIPTLLLFKEGKVVLTKIGAVRKSELEDMLSL